MTRPSMNPRAAFALIVALFFTWGFLTQLNDVLIADFRALFHLSYRSATLVQLTFFSTCFVASFPSSRLVARWGFRATMTIGLTVMAVAALCFVGAASLATFSLFLGALVVMAAGSTALQTAAGPYVCLLEDEGPDVAGGAREGSAAARFSLALGVNSLGAMLAPAFGAALLLRTAAPSAAALRVPYLLIAVGLVALACITLRSRLPPIPQAVTGAATRTTYAQLVGHPVFVFGALAMFLYVGAEIGVSSLLINFLAQSDTLGLTARNAAFLASFFGAGAMAGRFLGRFVLTRLRPTRALEGVTGAAFVLILTAVFARGPVSAYAVIAVGLANAVMVPILFTTAIAGLGPLTAKGSGLLVAALVGGAVIPYAQGALADRLGLHRSFLLPAACYLLIHAYAHYATGRRAVLL